MSTIRYMDKDKQAAAWDVVKFLMEAIGSSRIENFTVATSEKNARQVEVKFVVSAPEGEEDR